MNAIAAGVYETETTVDLFCKEWMDRVGENRLPLKKWGHRDPNLTCVVLFLSTEASLIPSEDSSITTVEKVTEYQNLVDLQPHFGWIPGHLYLVNCTKHLKCKSEAGCIHSFGERLACLLSNDASFSP